MGAQGNAAPVIIKRKKIVEGGGHHGGAWKVAYADFVTAMMAFFLLMWLLNATTEKQRKGLADYFSPTIPVSPVSGGGDGAFGGENMFSETALVQDGRGAVSRSATRSRQARGATGVDRQGKERAAAGDFEDIEAALLGRGGESLVSEKALKHIVTRLTDEGLIVELFATPDTPLFEDGTDRPTDMMRELMRIVADAAGRVSNDLAIGGHIRAYPVVLADNPVWRQSAARATRARTLLEGRGLDPARVQRVTGFADRKQTDANPMAVRNNRIEIIFLREI